MYRCGPAATLLLFFTLSACGPEEESSAQLAASESALSAAAASEFDPGSTAWFKSDNWSNGWPFDVGWRASNVQFTSGTMSLVLNDQGCPGSCSGELYASGEYQSVDRYGYGSFQVRMKAVKGSGLVSSFFINNMHPRDEIDIEILGKDPTRLQTNYWRDGVGGHETLIPLGFDASEAFHTYAIKWCSKRIDWYVDGVLVHSENGSRGPLPQRAGRMVMNLWASHSLGSWLGPFSYTGPVSASYEWASWSRR